MASCGNMLKSVLIAVVLVALTESAPEKLASCCKEVTREEIKDPIVGFLVQRNLPAPCVKAVILQTEKGLFCTYPQAPWVRSKIRAFMEKAKRQATPSPSVSPSRVSLLSIITSTAFPSSPSSPSSPSAPSSSSTYEAPVGENISDQNE